ncbi:hypothetical protein AAHZ94_34975, partial [Streptomyces sp. HSW2009]
TTPAAEAPAHLRQPSPAHPGPAVHEPDTHPAPAAYASERTAVATTRTAPPAITAGGAPGSTAGVTHAGPDGPPPPTTPTGRYASGPLDPFDPPGALDTLDPAHHPGAEAAGPGPCGVGGAGAFKKKPPPPPAARRGGGGGGG